MAIIITESKTTINTEEITRGTLIWAKHSSWGAGICGIVSGVTEEKITVRYLPSVQNVQNHFEIPASELTSEEPEWQVRYSSDGLVTVIEFNIEPEQEGGGE